MVNSNQINIGLKGELLSEIKKRGGFVNCHCHLDKSFYITKSGLNLAMLDMETKWHMSDDIKKNSTQKDIENRINRGLEILKKQGVKTTATFIDAYSAVGHKAIDAAIKVKREQKNIFNLLTITQPLGGLIKPAARKLYEEITAKADIAGGLPSKDRPNDDKNFDYLFSIAKNLNKPIHIHIDQENHPNERDTEKLIKYTIKHKYQGRVVAIHTISTAAQNKKYQLKLYKKIADSGISVVVCPSAALSMKALSQHKAPIHNSIANVPEMITAGIIVGLGTDNIEDFYQPFVDGDMWTELRMLMESCRYYNFEELANIASTNGQKILLIK